MANIRFVLFILLALVLLGPLRKSYIRHGRVTLLATAGALGCFFIGSYVTAMAHVPPPLSILIALALAAGAAVGAIAGDAGQGAAIGATAGAMKGRSQQKKQLAAAQQQAQQQAKATAQARKDQFSKAFCACAEGKGYSAK